MLFLQAAINADKMTFGTGLIASLLGIIITLVAYIYRQKELQDALRHKEQKEQAEERHKEQKEQAEQRHKDQMEIIKKLTERQDNIERRQNSQEYQLLTLNGVINIMQGKPFDYDSTKHK